MTDVKVYTNQPSAVLYVNGKKISSLKKDSLGRIIWTGVSLEKGENEIKVVSGKGRRVISDSCVWILK